jgi:prepilin-type N-terminal cleavage/methylation domain-containing protein
MKKGFTLVELAIVIVIVGIIAAMVFKGQTIYENSKLRSSLKNIEMIRTAFSNIAMDYEGLIPSISYFENDDVTNPVCDTPGDWENGIYSAECLLLSRGLLTDDKLVIYRRPDVKWTLISCNKGALDNNTHALIITPLPGSDNTHYGKHVCLTGNVSERFSCYFEKIMDDDNVTSAFARSEAPVPSGKYNFTACSEAELSSLSRFDYILY